MHVLALLLAAAALASPQTAPRPAAAMAAPVAQPEIRLDHISVVKLGSGPPVILIPGLASPREVWDGVAPGLARSHTVYLVQVNGFAGDDPGRNLNPGILQGIVADLHAYLRAEKVGPARLVGHSMGGLAGMMFAKAHPDQVDRLMIVDALPFFPVLIDPAASPASVEPIAKMMRDKVAARYGKTADSAALRSDVEGLALKPESRARMTQWAAAADSRVTAQVLFEDLTTDVRPQLASIATPITLVFPWSETAFGKERTEAFYRKQYATTSKVTYVGIADSGHFAMLDQPELFRKAISDFLDQ